MTRYRSGVLPRREPNGRHNRALDRIVQGVSPAEIRRLRDAALHSMRAAEWGTQLGLLLLREKLSATQYEAGRRFSSLAHQFHAALGAPGFPTTSLGQKASSGHTEGPTEAERHRLVIEAYNEAIAVLAPLEHGSLAIVRLCCERDASVSTADALRKLTYGLDALAQHWRIPP